jgi:hypothetical protein
MPAPKPRLTEEELMRPFEGEGAARFPAVLSPAQLGELLGKSPKTIYHWIAKGRLDGAFRKRGKSCLIWRDRALKIVFDGKDW